VKKKKTRRTRSYIGEKNWGGHWYEGSGLEFKKRKELVIVVKKREPGRKKKSRCGCAARKVWKSQLTKLPEDGTGMTKRKILLQFKRKGRLTVGNSPTQESFTRGKKGVRTGRLGGEKEKRVWRRVNPVFKAIGGIGGFKTKIGEGPLGWLSASVRGGAGPMPTQMSRVRGVVRDEEARFRQEVGG